MHNLVLHIFYFCLCDLHSLSSGSSDTVRINGEHYGKEWDLKAFCSSAENNSTGTRYIRTTEGKKKKDYSHLFFYPAHPLLECLQLCSSTFTSSPGIDKSHHPDSFSQSIIMHPIKLTSFYCLSAFRRFPALCNKCYSKENYLPNLQKEFYSPLQSAESQQTLW